MSTHEKIGESDDWYTPPNIFESLGLKFDLDPCSPGKSHWVPAEMVYTKEDDGLSKPWFGMVWMNPPFGGPRGQVPWLQKFFDHGRGIALVAARTSDHWFHAQAPRANSMLFPRGRTKFHRPDGSIGKSPGTGVVLFASGKEASEALRDSGLGIWVPVADAGLVNPS